MKFKKRLIASLIIASLPAIGLAQNSKPCSPASSAYCHKKNHHHHHKAQQHYCDHHYYMCENVPPHHHTVHTTHVYTHHVYRTHEYAAQEYRPHHYNRTEYAPVYKDAYKDMDMPVPVYVSRFDGAYLGIGFGAVSNNFSYHDALSNSINQGRVSPLIEIFGGYGVVAAQRYYFGGELYYNTTLGSGKSKNTVIDGGGTYVNLQTRGSLGLTFTPGVLVSESALSYLRIGAVGTQFYSLVDNPAVGQYNNRNKRIGLELGIGLRANMSPNSDIRLEYSHLMYKSYTTTINSYHMRPTADRINLGFMYRF